MGPAETKQDADEKKKRKRVPYEKPAIIYESVITTRAGSGITGAPEDEGGAADPADLFGG
jgi:hypothetical protein